MVQGKAKQQSKYRDGAVFDKANWDAKPSKAAFAKIAKIISPKIGQAQLRV